MYKHTSPSDKVYIGITSQTPEARWSNGQGYVGNDYFFKSIQKHGWCNFKHEILFEGLTKEDAEAKEIELIAQYNSTDRSKGYNISFGGAAPATGLHWKRPEEGILRGEKHPMYGKSPSAEVRQRISNKLRGRPLSEETKRKMRGRVPWNKGRSVSDVEKARISESLKGNIPQNRKPVLCIETGQTFESMTAAMQSVGITCIYKALHNPNRTAGGYHWQYIIEGSESH